MLTARACLSRSIRASVAARGLSTPGGAVAPPKPADASEDAVALVKEKRDALAKTDSFMIYGKPGDMLPAPVLPENPAEVALLDDADKVSSSASEDDVR
jgi:hypothetical protein